MSGPAKRATSLPAGYPADLEADVLLADGRAAELRPIRPSDASLLKRLHASLSPESVYLRFFSPAPRPTAVQLERLTSIDYHDRMVMVAELGDEIVAIARYDRSGGGGGRGRVHRRRRSAGPRSGHAPARAPGSAAGYGIHVFVADTLADNTKMLNVFRGRLGE